MSRSYSPPGSAFRSRSGPGSLGSFGGNEVFRSGCLWNRGCGKFFCFQPGHETCPSCHNKHVRTIIRNAVHDVARPGFRAPLECKAV